MKHMKRHETVRQLNDEFFLRKTKPSHGGRRQELRQHGQYGQHGQKQGDNLAGSISGVFVMTGGRGLRALQEGVDV